jgi:hypothetical protein
MTSALFQSTDFGLRPSAYLSGDRSGFGYGSYSFDLVIQRPPICPLSATLSALQVTQVHRSFWARDRGLRLANSKVHEIINHQSNFRSATRVFSYLETNAILTTKTKQRVKQVPQPLSSYMTRWDAGTPAL